MKAQLYFLKISILFFFLLGAVPIKAQTTDTAFDKNAFYSAMAGTDNKKIKAQLEILDKVSFSGKEAFEGALLMKKAGLGGNPLNKLSNFKEGHKKLEAAINEDNNNAEWRFLRLMIQENAPKFLGYNEELKKDSSFIGEHVETLDPEVQQAVFDYSTKSKLLNLDSLDNKPR